MKFSSLFSILVLGFSLAANAVAGPRYIYHLSTVMPTEIFKRGFFASGHDVELLRYMSGQSILDGTTSFVSATDSLDVALRIAKQAILKHREIPFWIYVIRPTEEVYDVTKSIHSAEQNVRNPDAWHQALALTLAFDWQRSWAAHGHVLSSQIVGAYPVILLFREEPFLGTLYRNENYIEDSSIVSDDVIPARDTPLDGAYIGEESSPGFSLTLSFSQDCEDHKLIPPRKVRCGTAKQLTFHDLIGHSVAGLIATGVLQSPGQGLLPQPFQRDEFLTSKQKHTHQRSFRAPERL